MDKIKIEKAISREMARCIGKEGGRLSADRERLKTEYIGTGYAVDEERQELGLSTYVDRTVMETVEWAKPGLFRIFSSDEIIRFEPKTPAQEQAAKDATLYINQVVFGRNMFKIVHDTLTDGLYQRAGWAIAKVDEVTEYELRELRGLMEAEAMAVLEACDPDDAEIVSYPAPAEVQAMAGAGTMLYDLKIRVPQKRTELAIDTVPPEQVIFSSDARTVEDAKFLAMWTIRTASDLRKDGVPESVLADLPKWDGDDMPETEIGRRINDDSQADGERGGSGAEYKVYEAWMGYDINGDGIDEKIRVKFCGGADSVTVLEAEEWPMYRAPLFAACSLPMPHQPVGLCLADLVEDIQKLKTELGRQYLDSLAYANSGELLVKEGPMSMVDYDSLLARAPGRVHRVSSDVEIQPLPTAPVSADALKGFDLADGIAEKRTGVSSRTQSIQADALQNTATGAAIMEDAINQRLELIARVFAEGFFKPLGRYALNLLHKYHDKPMQLKLKGRFMEFDPRNWDPDMDIGVAVGLGSGNRQRLVQSYNAILAMQVQFVQQLGAASPIGIPQIVYTCHKLAEASGLENPERFFGTEEDAARAQQMMMQMGSQGGKDQKEAAAKMQVEMLKANQKAMLDQRKAESDAQRKAWETQAKISLERQKIEGQHALKEQELNSEYNLDMARIQAGETGTGVVNLRSPV